MVPPEEFVFDEPILVPLASLKLVPPEEFVFDVGEVVTDACPELTGLVVGIGTAECCDVGDERIV